MCASSGCGWIEAQKQQPQKKKKKKQTSLARSVAFRLSFLPRSSSSPASLVVGTRCSLLLLCVRVTLSRCRKQASTNPHYQHQKNNSAVGLRGHQQLYCDDGPATINSAVQMRAGQGASTQDVQVLRLSRDSLSQPWGFRMQGGADIGFPLTVQRVFSGSPAEGILQRGDVIVKIDSYDTSNILHREAQDLVRISSNQITMTVKRYSANYASWPRQSSQTFAPEQTHYWTDQQSTPAPPSSWTPVQRPVQKSSTLMRPSQSRYGGGGEPDENQQPIRKFQMNFTLPQSQTNHSQQDGQEEVDYSFTKMSVNDRKKMFQDTSNQRGMSASLPRQRTYSTQSLSSSRMNSTYGQPQPQNDYGGWGAPAPFGGEKWRQTRTTSVSLSSVGSTSGQPHIYRSYPNNANETTHSSYMQPTRSGNQFSTSVRMSGGAGDGPPISLVQDGWHTIEHQHPSRRHSTNTYSSTSARTTSQPMNIKILQTGPRAQANRMTTSAYPSTGSYRNQFHPAYPAHMNVTPSTGTRTYPLAGGSNYTHYYQPLQVSAGLSNNCGGATPVSPRTPLSPSPRGATSYARSYPVNITPTSTTRSPRGRSMPPKERGEGSAPREWARPTAHNPPTNWNGPNNRSSYIQPSGPAQDTDFDWGKSELAQLIQEEEQKNKFFRQQNRQQSEPPDRSVPSRQWPGPSGGRPVAQATWNPKQRGIVNAADEERRGSVGISDF